jgi:ribonuclease BN (tRNA processing enzyme)
LWRGDPDAGSGNMESILPKIHHIFISHLHGDHVFGLFGLLSTLGMMGRKASTFISMARRHLKEAYMDQSYACFFGPLPFDLAVTSPGEI